MAPTFDSAGDEQQLVAVRKQIAAHRLRLPSKEVQELTKELERLKSEEEKAFDMQLVLRKLGLAQIRAGQVAIGRKNLVKSLNQLVYGSVSLSLWPFMFLCFQVISLLSFLVGIASSSVRLLFCSFPFVRRYAISFLLDSPLLVTPSLTSR